MGALKSRGSVALPDFGGLIWRKLRRAHLKSSVFVLVKMNEACSLMALVSIRGP